MCHSIAFINLSLYVCVNYIYKISLEMSRMRAETEMIGMGQICFNLGTLQLLQF